MIDVERPFLRIGVGASSESREESEFQMVVRVDEARHQLQAIERQGDALDAESHTRLHRAAKIAGNWDAASNLESLPICSKIARSGSPKQRSSRTSRSR